MTANKTTETAGSVSDFIEGIKDTAKQHDSLELIKLLEQQTGFEAKIWGPAIVGFGSYHYKYESGREGDAPLVGFSPRAAALSLYLSGNFDKRDELLHQLGKCKSEKGCIYIKKLSDIKLDVLHQMITNHIKHIQMLYPG
jgi:Domain of unknown function (DU1801).